jgi:hypothetical protein
MKPVHISFIVLILLFSTTLVGAQDFYLCEGNRKWNGITLQYYHVGTECPGGLRALRIYFSKLQLPPSDNTGYLTLRFMVNCKGDIGMFETLGCTRDFKEMHFDDKVTRAVTRALIDFGKWNAGKTGDGVAIDSQKFLTFVIDKGKLVDIVPK